MSEAMASVQELAVLETSLDSQVERLTAELKLLHQELAIDREHRRQSDATVKDLSRQMHALMATLGHDSVPLCIEKPGPRVRKFVEDPCHATQDREISALPRNSRELQRVTEMGRYAKLEDMTETGLEEFEFEYQGIPEDMWGVAIMLLTRERAELKVTVVFYVYKYIVSATVWTIQGQYYRFHKEVFNKVGDFQKDAWISWHGPREELCDAVMNNRLFLSVIIFLWFGRMIGELKLTWRLVKDIHALPGAAPGAGASQCVRLKTSAQDDKVMEIIAMSVGTRVLLYSCVIFPKLLVAILLMVLGGQWLTATLSYADLILNALALEFIIEIDENILSFFLPKRIIGRLDSTKFAYPVNRGSTREDGDALLLQDYLRNMIYFFGCVAMTIIWVNYAQQVLPFSGYDIAEHCKEWFMNQYSAKCNIFEKGCFPYGDVPAPHDYDRMLPS